MSAMERLQKQRNSKRKALKIYLGQGEPATGGQAAGATGRAGDGRAGGDDEPATGEWGEQGSVCWVAAALG